MASEQSAVKGIMYKLSKAWKVEERVLIAYVGFFATAKPCL